MTARVCSGCGAPIVGQPPVADTGVAETVATAVSDAAGKAVPAGVAGQALPEPYVPGSGEKLPAELRLVQREYAGVAFGLFAGALACATASVLFIFFADYLDRYNGLYDLLFGLALMAFVFGAFVGAWHGAEEGVHALQARVRFSRLLRRPSDPRTATVMASKRGGRTLILDIPWDGTGRGYQPLSEVRLALWTKAEMLIPDERVTVYGRPGSKNPLLVSSAQRGRAFLSTMEGRSTVGPGPLDEKVSGATLVEWAAWAASTTFSSTGLREGYDKREVDAFRIAVRDTFLPVLQPILRKLPVRSDDVRGKQLSTHRPGYDKAQVDAFLEAAGLRLAAMESTDRPVGPLVSGALLAGWADWADSTTFSKASWRRRGYEQKEVDAFREEIRDTFLGATRSPVRAFNVRGTVSSAIPFQREDPHYDKKQVDAFLVAAGIRLAAMESTDRPERLPVSGAILAGWAEWADSTRFSTRRLREGYDTAEVDAFREAIRDTFLGASKPPDEWPTVQDLMPWPSPSKHPARSDDVRGRQFSTHRPGYDPEQVDAFLDKAEPRLAAMRATD